GGFPSVGAMRAGGCSSSSGSLARSLVDQWPRLAVSGCAIGDVTALIERFGWSESIEKIELFVDVVAPKMLNMTREKVRSKLLAILEALGK
ncbi:unnamed protein product, partial [marine sediment metagenome]